MVLLTALTDRMNWTVLLRVRAHSSLASNQESAFCSIPSATIFRIAQTDRTKRAVVSSCNTDTSERLCMACDRFFKDKAVSSFQR